MDIKAGDKVKVISKNTMHEGKTGEVINEYEDAQTCRVRLEWAVDGDEFATAGVISGFFVSELEVLKGANQDEQIFKIAAALHTEVRNASWTWEQCLENAASLYRGGVRHEG
jgi:hypothetical protein